MGCTTPTQRPNFSSNNFNSLKGFAHIIVGGYQFIVHFLIYYCDRNHYFNKDDNIHKSEALKRNDKRILTLVEYQNWSLDKMIRKFVAKLFKYRILFEDILTFLGLNYIDASLIILYLIVLWNKYSKNQINRMIISHKKLLLKKLKSNLFKMDVRTFW